MNTLADTFDPPYYAVVFSSTQSGDTGGYQQMAERMEVLAMQQPGYLGIDSAREGVGITVSYWKDLNSIHAWKANVEHLEAQRLGRAQWYDHYRLRIARVEYNYGFDRSR